MFVVPLPSHYNPLPSINYSLPPQINVADLPTPPQPPILVESKTKIHLTEADFLEDTPQLPAVIDESSKPPCSIVEDNVPGSHIEEFPNFVPDHAV